MKKSGGNLLASHRPTKSLPHEARQEPRPPDSKPAEIGVQGWVVNDGDNPTPAVWAGRAISRELQALKVVFGMRDWPTAER